MNVGEARRMAEDLGYRLERVRGQDVWIVRDLHSDIQVRTAANGWSFEQTVRWLEKEHLHKRERD